MKKISIESVKKNISLDQDIVHLLYSYIDNDEELYKRQLIPIVKNIQRKMKSGKYDHSKAPKLWMYLVDEGARKYVKQFGGDVRSTFPKKERMEVAQQLADEYREEIEAQDGNMF